MTMAIINLLQIAKTFPPRVFAEYARKNGWTIEEVLSVAAVAYRRKA